MMKPCYCINPSCKQPDHPDNNNTQVNLERLDKIEKQLQKKNHFLNHPNQRIIN